MENLEAFRVLGWSKEYLIAKVLYDNGIKTEKEYVLWLREVEKKNIILTQALTVNVQNAFRDFDINFMNPAKVPNISKLKS